MGSFVIRQSDGWSTDRELVGVEDARRIGGSRRHRKIPL